MVCRKKEKMKKKLTWKIWFLIIFLGLSFFSIFSISNLFQDGVLITHVDANSTAFEQGFRKGQIIISVEENKISNVEDFFEIVEQKFKLNQSKYIIFKIKGAEIDYYSNHPPEIIVSDMSFLNIKLGLDLEGGSRALVQASEKKLSQQELNDLVSITRNRLDVYGISDVNVAPISDLEGNHYMSIEIAGATPGDLKKLIEEQGKFEAKIGEDTVFIGGEKDISSVCRNDATCAGIETCQKSGEQYFCNFRFSIYLSEDAAKKHAEVTGKLGISTENPGYLSEKLNLYVDDQLVDSLWISEELKAQVTTQISISGSGTGETEDEAYKNSKESMNNLQTILITGSLPYKLEIVKLDTISPSLGKDFTKSILFAGIAALLSVAIVVFFRYKKIKSSLALLITSISEIVIILGVASFISWNLDLPSIAGILATIGTGIDSQIIILDEAKQEQSISLKQRLKRAFAIILGTYCTSIAALIPLGWAVAGLFKGFAITTIIGITAGVFITRPAFSDMIKRIEE